ncbi:hypothetical protein L1987_04329 [Smallanthus sonchifolius]|uniref:Uncharacterized protein n=1 Tax=Smallanthus sonchifolius TaxID=185202 RepID=A0ACB9KDE8_9ASTR|nr:hypothetical protein L1987_04329 [Smallanthus sonchifolius]
MSSLVLFSKYLKKKPEIAKLFLQIYLPVFSVVYQIIILSKQDVGGYSATVHPVMVKVQSPYARWLHCLLVDLLHYSRERTGGTVILAPASSFKRLAIGRGFPVVGPVGRPSPSPLIDRVKP